MARKTWTQEEIDELEHRIRNKIKRGEKLTAGEDTVWGVLRNSKALEVSFVEEVDFLLGFDE